MKNHTQDRHPVTTEHEKDNLALERAKSARRIGTVLTTALSLLVFGHYVTVLILGLRGYGEIVKDLQSVFATFLPTVSGLLCIVAGYLFSRNAGAK